jgi:hypothetical protein
MVREIAVMTFRRPEMVPEDAVMTFRRPDMKPAIADQDSGPADQTCRGAVTLFLVDG